MRQEAFPNQCFYLLLDSQQIFIAVCQLDMLRRLSLNPQPFQGVSAPRLLLFPDRITGMLALRINCTFITSL